LFVSFLARFLVSCFAGCQMSSQEEDEHLEEDGAQHNSNNGVNEQLLEELKGTIDVVQKEVKTRLVLAEQASSLYEGVSYLQVTRRKRELFCCSFHVLQYAPRPRATKDKPNPRPIKNGPPSFSNMQIFFMFQMTKEFGTPQKLLHRLTSFITAQREKEKTRWILDDGPDITPVG
jgi:hypothetical protein